jgi:hypothetical protein
LVVTAEQQTCLHAGSRSGCRELKTARLNSVVIEEAGVLQQLLVAILAYFFQVNTPLALQALTSLGVSQYFMPVVLVSNQK